MCHNLQEHPGFHAGENESEVAQLCLTLSDPLDCSLPGSSVHGIFQARVLEWVAIAFSTGTHILTLKSFPLKMFHQNHVQVCVDLDLPIPKKE